MKEWVTDKRFQWALGIILLVAGLALVVWLAGIIFYLLNKANPFGTTDFYTWLNYWHYYQTNMAVARKLKFSLLLAIVVVYAPLLLAILAVLKDTRSLYGDARFATRAEIAKAKLFAPGNGILVGQKNHHYLVFTGEQSVFLAAPTRSGKGVGMVIPNLLNWSDSVVVIDIKGENFLITSGFRFRQGQSVYYFNPFAVTPEESSQFLNNKTHRYNPLSYISQNPYLRVAEINNIAQSIYPGAGRDAFFEQAAQNLFLGLVLYLCETPGLPRTMGELLRQSSGKGEPIKTYLEKIIHKRNYREVIATDKNTGRPISTRVRIVDWDNQGLPPLSDECVDALHRFLSTSDATLTSIMATFNAPLTMWSNPAVDAATSANDFDLRNIRKEKMSIYFGVPANRLKESLLLCNMFYSQLINLNMGDMLHSTPELKYQVLMVNDEFTALGRLRIMEANAYLAAYGFRLLTICQSPSQLESDPPNGYGREAARTLVTNHACQILFTPREQRDANEYSEMLGDETVKATSRSKSRQFSGGRNRSESETQSDHRRALLLPQELKEMSAREQIVILETTKPIRCQKICYYNDVHFMDRLKRVSVRLERLGRKLPTQFYFEKVWAAGELAAPVPELDMNLYMAKRQARIRAMVIEDVIKGFDLDQLAADTSVLTETQTQTQTQTQKQKQKQKQTQTQNTQLSADQAAIATDAFFASIESDTIESDTIESDTIESDTIVANPQEVVSIIEKEPSGATQIMEPKKATRNKPAVVDLSLLMN